METDTTLPIPVDYDAIEAEAYQNAFVEAQQPDQDALGITVETAPLSQVEVSDLPPPSATTPPTTPQDRSIISYAHKARAGVDIDSSTPLLKSTLNTLSADLASKGITGLDITSGFRSPSHNSAVGGAKGSQHTHGNAIDLDLKNFSEDQRKLIVQTILNNPNVGGIGFYSNGSIHFDVRAGGRAAWGNDYTSKTFEASAPAWAVPMVRAWQGQYAVGGVPLTDSAVGRGFIAPTALRPHLNEAAGRFGVDASLLTKIAGVESSFDVARTNGTSSATGLFQFITKDSPEGLSTWTRLLKKYGPELGLAADAKATDPRASSLLAAALLKENREGLKASLGRDPVDTDLYIAHFLGLDGAKRFLAAHKAGGADAAYNAVSVAASRANTAIFYGANGTPRTVKEVYDLFTQKLNGASSARGYSPGPITGSDLTPRPAMAPLPEWSTAAGQVARLRAGEAEMDFFGAVKAAWHDNPTASLIRLASSPSYTPDLNYKPDLKALTQGLSEKYHSRFEFAMNADHAAAIRTQSMAEQHTAIQLAEAGWTGTAASLLAGFVDPVNLASGIASGYATSALAQAARLSVPMQRVSSGLMGGASNVALDVAVARANGEELDHRSALFSAAIGLSMGAMFGNFKTPLGAKVAQANHEAAQALLKEVDPVTVAEARGLTAANDAGVPAASKRLGEMTEADMAAAVAKGARVQDLMDPIEAEVWGFLEPGSVPRAANDAGTAKPRTSAKAEAPGAFSEIEGVPSVRTADSPPSTPANLNTGDRVQTSPSRLAGDPANDTGDIPYRAGVVQTDGLPRTSSNDNTPVDFPEPPPSSPQKQAVGDGITYRPVPYAPPRLLPSEAVVADTKPFSLPDPETMLKGEGDAPSPRAVGISFDSSPSTAPAAKTGGTPPSGGSGGGPVDPPDVEDPVKGLAPDITGDDYARGATEGGAISSGGQLATSKNPVARVVGAALGVDTAFRRPDGVVLQQSADQVAARLEHQMFLQARSVYIPAYEEWAKDQGFSGFRAKFLGMGWKDFGRLVADAIEAADNSGFHPAVIRAAAEHRRVYAKLAELQNDPGKLKGRSGQFSSVRGAEALTPDKLYMHRVWSPSNIAKMAHLHGRENVYKLVAGALQIPDSAVAMKIAKAVVNARTTYTYGDDNILSRMANAHDKDNLRLIIKETVTDISDDEAEALVQMFGKNPNLGKESHLKQRRLDLNMQYGIDLADGSRLNMKELFERDADAVMQRYARKSSGRIAMASQQIVSEADGRVLFNGITSDADFEALKRQVVNEGNSRGLTPEEIKKDIDNLDFIYRRLTGKPSEADMASGEIGDWMRVITKFNFARLMGGLGMATLMDIGRPAAGLGVTAMLKQFTTIRRIVDMDGRTVLKSGLDRELEAIWGIGGSGRMHSFMQLNLEEAGNLRAMQRGRLVDKAENIMDAAAHLTSEMSGANYIQHQLRTWTGRAIAQKFADIASSTKLSKSDLSVIRFTGLSDEMFDRVVKEVRSNFTMEDGSLFGRKVTSMNLHKWDPEVRDAFEFALWRYSRHLVQENDIGGISRWMSNPLARALMQFRSYSLYAYENQLLHAGHNRDGRQAATALAAMFSGLVVYSAQVNLQSLGRSDAEEFRNQRLGDPMKLGYAVFQRSGFSSIAPMAIDTALLMTPFNGVFTHSTTGRPADVLFGNPTVGLFNDFGGFMKKLSTDIMQGDVPSQSALRTGSRLMVLGNQPLVTVFQNAAMSGLPEN